MKTRVLGASLLAGAGIASAFAGGACGGTIIEQERSVWAFVIVPQCAGQDADSQEAPGFDPFDASVEAGVTCDLAFGVAEADQQSEIGAALITTQGGASSQAVAVMMNVIHAIAHSFFEVSFNLDEESPFAVSALLTADASDAPIIVLSGATLSLTGPGGAAVFSFEVEPGPGGEPMSRDVRASGLLAAGTYTLRAQAASVIDNAVPPMRSGDSSFAITFSLGAPCPADTDGSGSVDVADLVNVILAWGTGEPAADVNGDGVVDVHDLLDVVLAWGPC